MYVCPKAFFFSLVSCCLSYLLNSNKLRQFLRGPMSNVINPLLMGFSGLNWCHIRYVHCFNMNMGCLNMVFLTWIGLSISAPIKGLKFLFYDFISFLYFLVRYSRCRPIVLIVYSLVYGYLRRDFLSRSEF